VEKDSSENRKPSSRPNLSLGSEAAQNFNSEGGGNRGKDRHKNKAKFCLFGDRKKSEQFRTYLKEITRDKLNRGV